MLTKKFFIKDEKGLFVHEDSIKKCGNEFFYTPTKQMDRWYTTQERAEQALRCLKLHNEIGKLGHNFKIECESKNTYYVIKDSQGNYVDERSIFLLNDDGQLEWRYFACKSCVDILVYPNREMAEKVANYLNQINQMSQFDLTFRAEEFVSGDDTKRENVHLSNPITMGQETICRNYYRACRKIYLSDKQETSNKVIAYAAGIPIEIETHLNQSEFDTLCNV